MSDLNYQKAVLVTDHTKVVFYVQAEDIILLPDDANGPRSLAVLPGQYIVWLAYEGPTWTAYTEEEFSTLYVTEENLPVHLADFLKGFGSYKEWCDSFEVAHA